MYTNKLVGEEHNANNHFVHELKTPGKSNSLNIKSHHEIYTNNSHVMLPCNWACTVSISAYRLPFSHSITFCAGCSHQPDLFILWLAGDRCCSPVLSSHNSGSQPYTLPTTLYAIHLFTAWLEIFHVGEWNNLEACQNQDFKNHPLYFSLLQRKK